LVLLGAVASPWTGLTDRGTAMARLPVHPRLARILVEAAAAGAAHLGAAVAAVCSGRDLRLPFRRGDPPPAPATSDLHDRLARLAEAERRRFAPDLRQDGTDPVAAREAARIRDDLRRLVPGGGDGPAADGLVERLVLAAFPDRVAVRSAPGSDKAAMTGGVTLSLDPGSVVLADTSARILVAYAVQDLGEHPRVAMRAATIIRQAVPVTEEDLAAVVPGGLRREDRQRYDETLDRVSVQAGVFYRDLALRLTSGAQADPGAVAACLAGALAPRWAALIAADAAAAALVARWRWHRRVRPDADLPELSDADLAAVIADACHGRRSRAEVAAAEKAPLIAGRLTWAQRTLLDREAPETCTVPTGSRIHLAYPDDDGPPVLAVRLQELFGQTTTPEVAGRPVLLHLLGPNYRVEQVTRDLASFWANTYPQVRKDLRGRYPKHSWPEDPRTAPPVRKGPAQRHGQ
jgi:ATP-dependent helicase HrpB